MKKTQQFGIALLIFLFMSQRNVPNENTGIAAIPANPDSIQNTSTTAASVQLPTPEAAR